MGLVKYGLGDYGRTGQYIARQVARWSRQYAELQTEHIPAMEKLAAWLPENVPPEDPTTIVHGDFRLDNLMFQSPAGGYPVAAVDWQTPGQGPATADVAYFMGAGPLPDDRRAMERGLVHDYLEALSGYGGIIGEVRDGLDDKSDIVYTALEEVALPPPWHRGRVQLIGDAAHASLPHMAQGAAMACEDAVVLAELCALDLPMEERLARFMSRRYERCQYVQKVSHAMADSQQDYTPETVAKVQAFLTREFPAMWEKNHARLAEPI